MNTMEQAVVDMLLAHPAYKLDDSTKATIEKRTVTFVEGGIVERLEIPGFGIIQKQF